MLTDDPHKFLNHTNTKHLNIKFTCKIESSRLPFHDILIIKDEFQATSCKKTYKGLYNTE